MPTSYSYSSTNIGVGGSTLYSPSLTKINERLSLSGVTGTEKGFGLTGQIGMQGTQFGSTSQNLEKTAGFFGEAGVVFNPHDPGFFAESSVSCSLGKNRDINNRFGIMDATLVNYNMEVGLAGVSQYSSCGSVDDNLVKFSLGAGAENNLLNKGLSNQSIFGKVKCELFSGAFSLKAGAMKTVENPTLQPFAQLTYGIGIGNSDRKRKY